MRTELGDCWDCGWGGKAEYVTLGGHKKVIITCGMLSVNSNGNGVSVMRSLPFRCPNWKKRKRLTIVDGGTAS